MNFPSIRRALVATYRDSIKNNSLQSAAVLSYYSIFGVFPAIILLSSAVAHIPVHNLFEDALFTLGRVAPPGTVPMIQSVLHDILDKDNGAWVSLGTLGTLWVISSTFDALIEAINSALDVKSTRPFWKTRILAVGLAVLTGIFWVCGIATMVVGPQAGRWIAAKMGLSQAFILVWPSLHWLLALIFALLTVETIYFLAPEVKQRFFDTLPGAVLAVSCWILLSRLLAFYFQHFANYNLTYGTLGGVMALMTWLYWAHFILLVGAELNAELAKEKSAGKAVVPEPGRVDHVRAA